MKRVRRSTAPPGEEVKRENPPRPLWERGNLSACMRPHREAKRTWKNKCSSVLSVRIRRERHREWPAKTADSALQPSGNGVVCRQNKCSHKCSHLFAPVVSLGTVPNLRPRQARPVILGTVPICRSSCSISVVLHCAFTSKSGRSPLRTRTTSIAAVSLSSLMAPSEYHAM